MKEITLGQAKFFYKLNKSIGYFIDYSDFKLKQIMDIAKNEIREIAQISGKIVEID